jgi:hypothetical protein
MTQHKVEIPLTDAEGWKNWVYCCKAMVNELRFLADEKTQAILDRFEARSCDYGLGLNIDWPDNYKCPDCGKVAQSIAVSSDSSDPFHQNCCAGCKDHDPRKVWKVWSTRK